MFFLLLNVRYCKACRVVLGRKRHIRPPLASRTATMKVGAGQYVSSKAAMTTLPMIPPRRAATIDTATPVALKLKNIFVLGDNFF